ncbi:MAG: M20 family metallopeptidase [Trueperaceae bacterium]
MTTTQRDTSASEARRARLAAAIDADWPYLEAFALDLHAHPELMFEEHRSAGKLVGSLREAGFEVEAPAGGLDTAFIARHGFGPGGPRIALMAEYDALPEIGHACGHNLIATAALGAARALRSALEASGGELLVIGCPAEEGGGGKILLLRAGVFEGVDAALMFHPGSRTMTIRGALAAARVTMRFYGKAAHAASTPELGINALDACLLTFHAINALRQHVKDETRIHGIITHGGSAPNIVPDYAEAKFLIRHRRHEEVDALKERVLAAARGAAAAVGARVEFDEGLAYAERRVNVPMAARFAAHLEAQGEAVKPAPAIGGVGSSDFGNVSQVVPAIHPYVAIVPEGVSAHTPEFAAAAASPAGMRGLRLAATALAATAADLITDPELLAAARADFGGTAAAGGTA